MIKVGEKVPNFKFKLADAQPTSLENLRGKTVLLYFYPKDNTPGCTQQACDFRDNFKSLEKINTVVIGVSRDSQKSHDKFTQNFNLPFPLISDQDESLCRLFDVIKPKKLYGKDYIGIERSTFVIDKNGVLRNEWRNVKVKGHIDEVLEAVRKL